jgi:hypothetical protein
VGCRAGIDRLKGGGHGSNTSLANPGANRDIILHNLRYAAADAARDGGGLSVATAGEGADSVSSRCVAMLPLLVTSARAFAVRVQ